MRNVSVVFPIVCALFVAPMVVCADAARYDRNLVIESVTVPSDVKWVDGRGLPLEGRAFCDVDHYYDRLPSGLSTNINVGVHEMKHHTAGMKFRFRTDASRLYIKWRAYTNTWCSGQMPATAVSGIDVYRYDEEAERWRFVRAGCMADIASGGAILTDWRPNETCLINLPLYNGIAEFKLGIASTNTIAPAPQRKSDRRLPVVFYGTSITQGAPASRPGMSFVNIVGRHLDVPVVNLGFSGCGKMEIEMSDCLARIDAACYVLDCQWNMGERLLRERFEPFVRNLRAKRPQVPILLVEQSDAFYVQGISPSRFAAKDRIIREAYERMKAEGRDGLHYLKMNEMYSQDAEGTTDTVHPNDYGMMSMARAFERAIEGVLSGSLEGGSKRETSHP